MLTEGAARRAFELLDASGLLAEVLPEVVKMHGVEQPPQFHPEGDVWVHTMLLLEQLPAGCSPHAGVGRRCCTMLASRRRSHRLPVRTIAFASTGMWRWACAWRRRSARGCDWRITRRTQIASLVKNHMRFGDVMQMKESTLKRFLRLENLPEHLELHRMDCMAAHGDLTLYKFARAAYEKHPEEEVRPALLLTGRELIAAGYRPGERFKEMLAFAEDAQLEGRVTTTDEALALVKKQFGID